MKDFKREDLLFSLCGLNCGLCPMKIGRYCPGCGGGEGNQPCRIAKCSLQHGGMEYCFQCGEFCSENYENIDACDSFITHSRRLKDLERAKEIGAAAYRGEQEEKAGILKELLEGYNDGRRKTLFCLAVNLLELSDIRAVMEQLRQTTETDPPSLKDKAARAAGLLKAAAAEKNIVLKLRKKPGKK